jgi:hypothetical protein
MLPRLSMSFHADCTTFQEFCDAPQFLWCGNESYFY